MNDLERRRALSWVGTAALLLTVAFTPNAIALPPLTQEQQLRLETARDGRDHREEAFIALLENVRLWTGQVGDTPVRLHVDVQQLIGNPDEHRGDVVRVAGRLEQRTALERQYEAVEEWFVRLDDGTPVVVFVAGLEEAAVWRDGQQVELFARFYKRLDASDRQGQQRQYAAFVAAHPQFVAASPATGVVQLWMVAVPVLALLIAFALLLVFVRRQRGGRSRVRRTWPMAHELDEAGELPDDPAEALAELRRRAEV